MELFGYATGCHVSVEVFLDFGCSSPLFKKCYLKTHKNHLTLTTILERL